MLQVLPAAITVPIVHVVPVGLIENVPPAVPTLLTVALAVSVIDPPALFVTVIVPLCGVVVPVTSDGLGAEKVTVVLVPVSDTFTVLAGDKKLTGNVADLPPLDVGANCTPIVQLVPGVKTLGVVPQSVAPEVTRWN